MNVLYRKYRPQKFSEVLGQENIINILTNSVLENKIAHAYLFSGPRGCGKTSIARIMAKAINCQNFHTKNDVCDKCEYCVAIQSGSAMDLIEMDAASNRGIDEIRTLKENLNFLPNFLKKKIYIIDEAHMLTKEAFNALLKTLEEPPEHVVFILATTEAHKLPITILSRLIKLDISLATEEQMIKKLKFVSKNEGISISEDALKLIYKLSGGSFRDSESLLGKILLSNKSENKDEVGVKQLEEQLGIGSGELIEKILSALMAGDGVDLLNLISQSNGLDEVLLIDQLMELITTKIKSGDMANFQNYLRITNGLVELKRNMREFTNKQSVFQAGILGITNPELRITNEEKNENRKAKTEKENQTIMSNNQPGISVQRPDTNDHQLTGDVDSQIKESILAKFGNTSVRLKSLLSTTIFELSETSLVVKNYHKINITYLSKKEVREILLDFLKASGKQLGISYQVIEMESTKDKVQSTNFSDQGLGTSDQRPTTSNNLQSPPKAVSNSIKKVTKTNEDNTELVESILN